jgi:acetyl esterase/lipase
MHRSVATALFFLVLTSSAIAKPDPSKIVEYKTIGDVKLTLHIFNPSDHKPSDKTPAIVFFFGGGWNGGTPSQFYSQSEYLASRGMVAICADYRTNKKHKTSPQECVKDGKSAIRWIRTHAADLGIDPNKLAAGGGSAGGHVAAATGTVEGFNEVGESESVSCRPNALVLFNPVFDNSENGYGYDRVKDYWKAFSPMHNIDRGTPPTIVFLGTKDKLIPVATANEFKKRMEAAGVRCDLHLYEGQPHGFFNQAKYSETLTETDKFLTSLQYIRGEPIQGNR